MNRGDIYMVDLNPTVGHEQQGARPVVVLSPAALNRVSPALIAPITSGGFAARYGGMAVSLTGAGTDTTGVALCNQIRTIDIRGRKGKFVEALPDAVVAEILARVVDIFELDKAES
nr:type II toxin-antitoxin system PemK/MazF family toxin [Roseiarcus fermentans]